MGKFLSGALTVLLIGGIGFLGYSVAEPIINYSKHKGDEPATTVPPTEQATAPTEEAVLATESPTQAVTVPAEPQYYLAAALKETDLVNINNFRNALNAIPKEQEFEYVELPIKTAGGNVYYASAVAEAQTAIRSMLTLSEMVQEIENCGYKAAAVVSVFRDNTLPANYNDAGFVKAMDGTLWTDANGLAWASPYAQRTLDYNLEIISELLYAGFDQIICSDMVFPDFTETDLENLDPVLAQNDRCMSLTSTANLLYDMAVSNGASMKIEVSAEDIIAGRTDILQPLLLSSNNIILNIDIDVLTNGIAKGTAVTEFSGTAPEKVEQCLSLVNGEIIDFNTAIRISGGNLTSQEISDIKRVLSDYGYKSFVIG